MKSPLATVKRILFQTVFLKDIKISLRILKSYGMFAQIVLKFKFVKEAILFLYEFPTIL